MEKSIQGRAMAFWRKIKICLFAFGIIMPQLALAATDYVIDNPGGIGIPRITPPGIIYGASGAPLYFGNSDTLLINTGNGTPAVVTPALFPYAPVFYANGANATITITAGSPVTNDPAPGGTVFQNSINGGLTITNAGTIYATGSNASNSLILGNGFENPYLYFTNTGSGSSLGTIVLSSFYNGHITLNGSGNHTGNITLGGNGFSLNLNSTGTVVGNVTGTGNSSLNVGNSGSATLGGTVTNVRSIQIAGSLTTGGAITGVSSALNLYTSNAVLNVNHNISGTGNFSNGGVVNIANGVTLNVSGVFALSGTLNVSGIFTFPSSTSYNAGTINVNGSGSITGGPITGTTSGSALRIGPSSANTFNYSGNITNIGNIEVINGSFTSSGTISGLNTKLSVNPGRSATFNGNVSGSGYISNSGTINIAAGKSFHLSLSLTNTGTINSAGAFTLPSIVSVNSGAININGSGGSLSGNLSGSLGSSLNFGTTSVGTPTAVTTTYSGNISGLSALTTVTSGTDVTFAGTISLLTALTLGSNTTARFNNSVGVSTVTVNSGAALFNGLGKIFSMAGALTNSGSINIEGAFTIGSVSGVNNTGSIYINNGGSLSVTGGGLNGGAGSALHIGQISSGSNIAANVAIASAINGIESISLTTNGTTFTAQNTISNLDTLLSVAGGTSATFKGNVSGTAAIQNSGSITVGNNTNFNLTGALINVGTINVFGEGSTTTYTVPSGGITTNTGTFNIYGQGARISGAFNPTNTSATATLNIGSDENNVLYPTTDYTTNNTITKIPLINVNAGIFTVDTGDNISEVTDFYVASGAEAIFNDANLIGVAASALTNTYTLGGTVTLNGTSTVTNFNEFAIRTNGNLKFNTGTTFTLPSTARIIGGANSTNTTLTVTNGTTLEVSNTISDLTFINITGPFPAVSRLETSSSISNIGTVTVDRDSVLELLPGGSVSSFDTLVLDGILQIDAGATFTLSSNQNIVQTAGQTNGAINNFGQLTLNGSLVTFPGSFDNKSTGTLTLTGTPTLNFEGSTFINSGNIQANFSTSNTLPAITTNAVSPDLSHGTIIIGYNNNYIAGGTYDFILAPNSNALLDPGLAILPKPSTYITRWSLASTQTAVQVLVERDGFGAHALTEAAQEVGNYLEKLGANNPTQAELNLLNSLEQIDNDAELTAALESLLPPQYTMLTTLDMLDAVVGALDIRLFSLQQGYGAGDIVSSDANGFWVRPFYSDGKQATTETLTGYTNKCHGWILGLDRTINNNLTLGVSGSISKTNVVQTNQTTTTTNINNYEGAFYGTYRTDNNSYLDAILAGGVSNYHGNRSIVLPDFFANAAANYSSQQITIKMMASRNFSLYDTLQLTPKALAQYSFIRQLAYTETGAGPYNMFVDPDNINLFRLGAGTSLGIPFSSNNMLSIPSVIGMVYVDANGGANTVNCQFVTGGPFITNISQQGRIMIRLGVNYELKLNDKLQMVAGYDYYARRSFQGHDAYLNLRYTF